MKQNAAKSSSDSNGMESKMGIDGSSRTGSLAASATSHDVAEHAKVPSSDSLSRRRFLVGAGSLATAALTTTPAATAEAEKSAPPTASPTASPASALIDTNAYLGCWPFRRTTLDSGAALRDKLRQHQVGEAWVGHLDALLHKNLSAVNARLFEECQALDPTLFRPVGSVHPGLPGWREDLRRCVEEFGMRAIRLHPNYHGYAVDDPAAVELLRMAAEQGLLVQIPVILEEERTLHPLVTVPPVDTAPLGGLVADIPGLRVQLLNAFRTLRGLALASLAGRGIHFDIAMLEGMEGVANLIRQIPAEQVCFGSYAPVFYYESNLLKLRESVLSDEHALAVRSGNARALLG